MPPSTDPTSTTISHIQTQHTVIKVPCSYKLSILSLDAFATSFFSRLTFGLPSASSPLETALLLLDEDDCTRPAWTALLRISPHVRVSLPRRLWRRVYFGIVLSSA